MSLDDESFQRALLETVEKALLDVLGQKIASALQFYVDLKSALKTPDRFIAIMFDLVGPKQAENLRDRILQGLYNRFGVEYRPSSAKLSEEIASLRSHAIG